jgi:hypothetical protein
MEWVALVSSLYSRADLKSTQGAVEELIQERCAAPVKQDEEGKRGVSKNDIRRARLTKSCADCRKQIS